MAEHVSQVFITGVSSGLGLGLTREFLKRGWEVFGSCRHAPELGKKSEFHFASCDLTKNKEIAPALNRLLGHRTQLDLVVLNAGILGPFGELAEQSLEDMQRVMQVNMWANKVILDYLNTSSIAVRQVVTISSGASVNGHRGWGGYALSKAALNMLTALAAAERPETHYCALAPGLVDTAMQDQLCGEPADSRYPSLERLRARRGTAAMPDGDELAPRLIDIMQKLPKLVTSGSFADIRKPPLKKG